jgi:hypothetical protein
VVAAARAGTIAGSFLTRVVAVFLRRVADSRSPEKRILRFRMPFTQIIPRPFTSDGVQMYAPVASGVYGISNAREWIFIGETADIQGALLAHVQEPHTSLMKRKPTGFVFEVCDPARRPSRQDRLVVEYGPTCNRTQSRYS